jgi:hypothetical protein
MHIPFSKKNIDQKKTASLFGDTIFGDTFPVFPFPKIDFGTFQLGIAQLVPQVRGPSGSHPPPPSLPNSVKNTSREETLT